MTSSEFRPLKSANSQLEPSRSSALIGDSAAIAEVLPKTASKSPAQLRQWTLSLASPRHPWHRRAAADTTAPPARPEAHLPQPDRARPLQHQRRARTPPLDSDTPMLGRVPQWTRPPAAHPRRNPHTPPPPSIARAEQRLATAGTRHLDRAPRRLPLATTGPCDAETRRALVHTHRKL
eukprot:1760945-Prymnesium_polylepis.2